METGTTVFILGLSGYEQGLFGKRWETLFDHLAENGGRLVISFPSIKHEIKQKPSKKEEEVKTPDEPEDRSECETADGGKDSAEGNAQDECEDKEEDLWAGISELGIRFMHQGADKTSEEQEAVKTSAAADYLPEKVFWPLTGHFKIKDAVWDILYTQNDAPVMAARPWGQGTVVMMADSYLFSNEGLQKNRAPMLLAWLSGTGGKLVFDEFHHGLLETAGTVDLIKKYRLQGMVLSLFIVVALLIWRQMALMPIVTDMPEKQTATREGAEPSQGWVALVERHIPPKELLNVCYNAWRSSTASNRVPKERQKEAQDIMTAHRTDYHKHKNRSTYIKLYKLIKQGKRS